MPKYSVTELNSAIGNLLERGFSPKFLLNATVSKSQVKKGHQWLTLTDGKSSITAVIWSSILQKINFHPSLDDGVLIIGKLNYWNTRASLSVQVIDVKPTISTVLRKFELVKNKLEQEGLLDRLRHRKLPLYPKSIAVLTSVPSSAFADIKRTAQERWPLTRLIVIPIPVQGDVEDHLLSILIGLSKIYHKFDIEAVILARGGGSREDLIVFDSEKLCRELSNFPIPIITGLGHEDDTTVSDLVADFRASTPTAAMASLLPNRQEAIGQCREKKSRLIDYCSWQIAQYSKDLYHKKLILDDKKIEHFLLSQRVKLENCKQVLKAFSLQKLLNRGFSIVKDSNGRIITSRKHIALHDKVTIILSDGKFDSIVESIQS